MKVYTFNIDERQVAQFFSPLREKLGVVELLMKTIKVMLISCSLNESLVKGQVMLVVSKMSRLFYFTTDKYFSIRFPFTVLDDGDIVKFVSKHGDDIDSKVTSDILAIITSPNALNSVDIYDFLDPVTEIVDDSINFWSLLREMLLFEDGYVRYDFDNKYQNGDIHPLNHLDIFYSTGSTFKIGLRGRIRSEHLVDLLNIDTNCHYLNTK